MYNKKIFLIIITVAIILIAGAAAWYFYAGQNTQSQLEKLKTDYPALASAVDSVIKWENKLKEDEARVESYATLGLAWKGLADAACGLKTPDCEKYYAEALKVYEKAITVTKRRNTLFLMNAGNMARYLKDYARAEDYYREALSVAPGDADIYLTLGELYEYDLKKSKEEIFTLYEEGAKRVLNSAVFEKAKEEYSERNH